MEREVKADARAEAGAARIARTEALVVDAARELFLERGYVATALTEVAERAGVAPRTVYVRFGTKAALFRRVVDEALAGDAEPIDVAHRPQAQYAMTAPTLRERLDALADISIGIADRAGALFEVAAQAEGAEPEIADAAQAGREETARMCGEFWHLAKKDGLLGSEVEVRPLSLTTDALVCADTMVHLRRVYGWSAAQYGPWLREALHALVR
ncbi:TetR/AcrR family transcriptional regulator [Amycolatopsis jejuensis]|uniref:TetR/AcrR family transcriptional regulator n=1 Tax=Amycolatopsis jejuensis TaxID=330084 RepID=UPI000526FFF3|nr:TetR/AcrR family transcriptional regulator [Amycolatopsis jejuensis]